MLIDGIHLRHLWPVWWALHCPGYTSATLHAGRLSPLPRAGILCLAHLTGWLLQQVCDMVTGETGVYMYDRSLQKPRNPNKKRRWLIPIIFAAQIAFKVLILDMWMEEDGARGDQYGPYEKEFVEQERARRRAEKEQRRAAAQGKEDRRRGIPTPSRLEPSAPGKVSNDMFDDDDEDDF